MISMSAEIASMKKSLAVVVFIDVVGYSKLISANEDKALRLISEFVAQHLNPSVARNNGKIIKAMGDGWMLSFPSCFDAINFTDILKTQLSHTELNLRYGIHMGDIQSDGIDLYGDTVNIAARLEAISGINAITISNSVFLSLDEGHKSIFLDQGEITLKNISTAIRVWSSAEINQLSGAMVAETNPTATRLVIKPFGITKELSNFSNNFEEVLDQTYQSLVSKEWLNVIKTDYEGPNDYTLKLKSRHISGLIQINANLTRSDGVTLWTDAFNIRPAHFDALIETIADKIVSQVLIKLIKYKKDFA